jgi:hypothetical protein
VAPAAPAAPGADGAAVCRCVRPIPRCGLSRHRLRPELQEEPPAGRAGGAADIRGAGSVAPGNTPVPLFHREIVRKRANLRARPGARGEAGALWRGIRAENAPTSVADTQHRERWAPFRAKRSAKRPPRTTRPRIHHIERNGVRGRVLVRRGCLVAGTAPDVHPPDSTRVLVTMRSRSQATTQEVLVARGP